jgi:hypothetical protein
MFRPENSIRVDHLKRSIFRLENLSEIRTRFDRDPREIVFSGNVDLKDFLDALDHESDRSP